MTKGEKPMISASILKIGIEVHGWVTRYEELKARLAKHNMYHCPSCGTFSDIHDPQCTPELRESMGFDGFTAEQIAANETGKLLQEEFKMYVPNAIEHFTPMLSQFFAENEKKGDMDFRRALILEMIREGMDWEDSISKAFDIEKELRKREMRL